MNSRPKTLDKALQEVKWYRHSHRAIFGTKTRKEVREAEYIDDHNTHTLRSQPPSCWAARPFPEAEYINDHNAHTLCSQPPSRWVARPFPEAEYINDHNAHTLCLQPSRWAARPFPEAEHPEDHNVCAVSSYLSSHPSESVANP